MSISDVNERSELVLECVQVCLARLLTTTPNGYQSFDDFVHTEFESYSFNERDFGFALCCIAGGAQAAHEAIEVGKSVKDAFDYALVQASIRGLDLYLLDTKSEFLSNGGLLQ